MMAELLAPAGSLEAVFTAIDAGADAIYLGGKRFNARKFAHNLDDDELRKAVTTAHLFGVRIYVTVNILVADKELRELAAYLTFLDTIQVDGIIVQDLAAAKIAHDVAPNLPIHGSTQMTVADIDGVRFLADLGFTQAVLARELSLSEIKAICQASPIPIEVFIHGAQCMSYSGQCLMSSFIGGRSGNRGACAQPCRLPYRLVKDGKPFGKEDRYLLSLKDLNAAEYIHELMDAGVASFKIEGRMKGNGYVRTVVSAYRGIMDSHAASKGEQMLAAKEGHLLLQESFNRTYQHDFLVNTIGRSTITEKAGSNQGKRAGIITACRGTQAEALLDEELDPGDIVKVCNDRGEEWVDEVQEVTGSFTRKKQFTIFFRRHDIGTGTLFRLSKKEDRNAKCNGLAKKIPLYGHVDTGEDGQLRLTMWDESGHTVSCTGDFTPPKAKKRPATAEWVCQQLSRLGDTPFVLNGATLWDEMHMIPASVLNKLRREAVDQIAAQILDEYERPLPGKVTKRNMAVPKAMPIRKAMGISLRCDTIEAIAAAGKNGADRVIFGGESYHHRGFSAKIWQDAVAAARMYEMEIWAATPRVVKEAYRTQVEAELRAAVEAGCDGIYAGAVSIFAMAAQVAPEVPVYADWSLNIFNGTAASAYAALGCQGIALSPECTLHQIENIGKACAVPLEVLAAGRIEMMITEYCSVAALAGSGKKTGCPGICSNGRYALRDRKDSIFPIGTDQYCHNHVLNSRDLDMVPYVAKLRRAGLSWLRVEGRGRDTAWISRQIRLYARILDGTETMLFSKENEDVTRGHFFHGIL